MLDNLENSSNYLRLISMVIDLGTEVMLLLFFHLKPEEKVSAFFSEPGVREKLDYMKRRNILKPRQYRILTLPYPNPREFDLTLLITLLSNIFEDKIKAPIHGWGTFPPASDDFSIGADLLRLKRIRNEIVGHHVKAQLSNTEFTDLWQQTESLLLRIVEAVDLKEKASYESKFSAYTTRSLQTTVDAQKALETVQMWYAEINILQEQVADMAKKTKELYDKLQYVQQDHRKYFSLLVEGGRMVLVGIWQRETRTYQDKEIWNMLKQTRNFLENEFHRNLEDLLSHGVRNGSIQVDNLDILHLGTLIIHLFPSELDESEVSAVKELICWRRRYTEVAFTSNKTFIRQWTALVMNLTSLAAVQTTEIQSRLTEKVNHISENEDLEETGECLKEIVENVRGLKTLSDEYKENVDKLKESLKQMREEGIPFGEEKTIVFKMHIKGSSKEMSVKAEEIVNSTISKALELTNYSNEDEEITNAVDKILDHIRNIDGATLLSSERSCILLTFTCTSYCGILNLLDFFESRALKEQMFDLAQSLSFYLSDEFIILATVSPKSIVALQEISEVKTQGCYVPIKVSCATVSSLNEVYRCFDANAVNSTADVNTLADVLSRELNDTYNIQLSADIGTNKHLLLEEKDDGSNSFKPKHSENAMEMKDEMPNLYEHIQADKVTDGATGCSADDEVPRPDIATIISKGKYPINSLKELNAGDVVSTSYYLFEHQVLVTDVQVDDNDTRRGSIKCIHYRLPSIFTFTTRKIVREQIAVDLKRDSLYRVDYNGGIFSTEEAISRANKRIGEKKWSTSNRSEHLCYWAKVKPITNKEDYSSLIKPSSRSMRMKEMEIHLADELQEGDVIYYKTDGILVNVESLDGGIGRKFQIEKVAYDDYDFIVREKHYTIDLNKDFISVKKYSSPYCVSMTERVKRALSYVGTIGKWWSRYEFIKSCIKESRYDL